MKERKGSDMEKHLGVACRTDFGFVNHLNTDGVVLQYQGMDTAHIDH